ncbi:S27A3 protein, partial [Bucorvus abyssinicus]|nr:S27A3 protein [Bucorvus abyssinicus]
PPGPSPQLFSPFEIVRYDVSAGAPVRDAAGRCIRVRAGERRGWQGGGCGLGGPPGCSLPSPVPIPAGETGLLIAPVTPSTPFLGYAGSRELSEQKLLRGVFAEGDTYFSTGDLMEQDAAQFVRFRDRTGDTYRWKGENVATTEVAEALVAHESLQEATVYGVTVPG